MSEIRKDPASRTWVIVATERADRPHDLKIKERRAPTPASDCPFCGDERPIEDFGVKIEGEVYRVKVLANKFPALRPEENLSMEQADSIYNYLTGVGAHEVIVESPVHDDTLASMDRSQLEAALYAYVDRLRHWEHDPRMRYVLIFKNYGRAAGASLFHPHSQLIALPFIPPRITEELDEAKDYFESAEECVYCRMNSEELAHGERMIAENRSFLAYSPYAARFPFELRVIPNRHVADFSASRAAELADLAAILKDLAGRLSEALGEPPFNFMLHESPLKTSDLVYYHWHLEIIPRLTMPAGFEWGSGVYINAVTPERAARELREVAVGAR